MKHILLFDTAIGSDNIGDEIIMDYCTNQLSELFNNDLLFCDRVPTHLEIGKTAYQLNKRALYSFVCGTNILKTSVLYKKLWKLDFSAALNLRNICLMGVGWNNYTRFGSDIYTKWIYRSILSRNLLHSVRDHFTEEKLRNIGIKNVINTSCPTMWRLTPEHCKSIPKVKSKEVVTALTHYNKDLEKDKLMLNILHENYSKIYLWLQQPQDYEYFLSLQMPFKVEFIKPLLSEYDALLGSHQIDFVGSRLHGGIRALNFKKRALIIGIDNRATEINRDTNLPMILRSNIENIDKWINGEQKVEIYLPVENILKWKKQFEF